MFAFCHSYCQYRRSKAKVKGSATGGGGRGASGGLEWLRRRLGGQDDIVGVSRSPFGANKKFDFEKNQSKISTKISTQDFGN